ncbi:hypothetical protein Misp04_55010 [Micromonospora sp. NBRC 101691]|nr:hypothetical protein Misp04_55010 [Micromonospora sp. NBRC 101691]
MACRNDGLAGAGGNRNDELAGPGGDRNDALAGPGGDRGAGLRCRLVGVHPWAARRAVRLARLRREPPGG